jgi:hypothetical protein
MPEKAPILLSERRRLSAYITLHLRPAWLRFVLRSSVGLIFLFASSQKGLSGYLSVALVGGGDHHGKICGSSTPFGIAATPENDFEAV